MSFWNKKFDKDPSVNLRDLLESRGYTATCDFPSCNFYKEQMEIYPDAKVILTVRDPEAWYKSCEDTIFRHQPTRPATAVGVKVALSLGYPKSEFGAMVSCRL